MSQPNMMNQNLPNGIPPQFNTIQPPPPQEKVASSFNGLDSSHSSRNSSPLQRYHQIPSSQLPPSRTSIPASQLPPNRGPNLNVNQITHGYSQLSISGTNTNEATPISSPKVQAFSTSTPIQQDLAKNEISDEQNKLKASVTSNFNPSVLSPISTVTRQTVASTESTFTHSVTSKFTNTLKQDRIPQNDGNNTNKLSDTVINRNTPLSQSVAGKQNMSQGIAGTSQVNDSVQTFISDNNTNLQNPIIKTQQQPENRQQRPDLHSYFGSVQENLQTNITQPQQFPMSHQPVHTMGQYQKVNHNPLNSRNVPVQSVQPQVITEHQPNILPAASNSFSSSNIANSYQPIHPGQKSAFIQPNISMSNQRIQTNAFPQALHIPGSVPNQVPPMANFNTTVRPKMQSSSSQPRLNTSMPPSPYNQSVNLPPSNSQISEFGSMPNLTQVPPKSGISSSNVLAPPLNLQNIPQPNFQDVPPLNMHQSNTPNQTQSRVSNIHASRYPSMPVSSNIPQQGYMQQTYQQNLYNNQQNFQNQPQPQFPNQLNYQNQPQTQFQNYNKTTAGVTQAGFNKLWGYESFDLLQSPNVLPATKVEAPKISLGQDFLDAVNCNSDVFRCTVTKIPETSSLLHKSRLPLGILIHPFRDLNHLPVIQCNTIVRCRACRTYINPFVFFIDSKRWKCNLCYRVNELPDEFQYDPISKSYGDPSRRPEIKSSTIEYIAPAEYMLRPPQPAVYLFLLDVSRYAVESGYLHTVCNVLSAELTNLPGDARTHIGFLAYDSTLHFYSLSEGQSQPHEMTVLDIEDIFLPCPDNLLVNLQDRLELISDLLSQLPLRYNNTFETNSALGAALQAAYKMMAGTGGRVTVFQAVLPTLGPGSLVSREDPSQRASTETPHLNPANDFYKRLALECSGQQIAVDLFILNSQYVDLATISGISKFSGGCIHHFPLFNAKRTLHNDALDKCFRRYITRKIGFEAVMRIRCTRGLSIHSFHGNFFVRSTDLLSLPNINPDAGFGMQVAIEESLSDVQTVCFQAALLYTSSKGERRIRVHTMCLPVANTLTDIINSADQQCIIGLLSKMAVDRSTQSSLSDAREAFLNVAIDILSSYKLSLNMGSKTNDLLAPQCLKLLPLYISALLKSIAFRVGTSTRVDDRIKAMCDMKTKPLPYLIQQIYPDLYPIHNLEEQNVILNEEEERVHVPPRLQLTARNIDINGAYLLDVGEQIIILVCSEVSSIFLNQVLGAANFNLINEEMHELPVLENAHNQRLHTFINYLNDEKPFAATTQIIRENSPNRVVFLERLIEDRMENSLSYHEFLQHIKTQVK